MPETIYAPALAPAADAEPVAVSFTDSIDTPGATGTYEIELEAGHSYLFALSGAGDTPLKDPVLGITLPGSEDTLALDDDGGQGVSSLLTFTPSESGTYVINAGGNNNGTGGFEIHVREAAADDVGNDFDAAGELGPNTTAFDFLETQDDTDVYHFSVTAGLVYTIQLSGGADAASGSPLPATELDTVLSIYDSNHQLVTQIDNLDDDDLSSGIGFQAATSGDYYAVVSANNAHDTAGYTLSLSEVSTEGLNPLDTINWGPDAKLASNTVTVYFAGEGETIGDYTSEGWSKYEIGRAMAALGEWAAVANLTFSITDDPDAATFKLVKSQQIGATLLGMFNPPGETDAGVGVFNPVGAGWDTEGGLERGGYGYVTLVHEFGHGLGLAHPHDDGGNSQVMPGVIGPTGTLGAYNLNQTVYTIMSYNDGWVLHPDAGLGLPGPAGETGYGQPTGPSALDIAEIQAKYGAVDHASGDTTYTMSGTNTPGTLYQTIWDTGGNDTIRYNGSADATIDLTAATLDYSATGGGVISYVSGVFGGFTIANGVVIETAKGGSGNDKLTGNGAANTLAGGDGNDTLDGRGGDDLMKGGAGDDIYHVDSTGDHVIEYAGGGVDTVYASADYNLVGQYVEVLYLTGAAVSGAGNNQNNAIYGNAVDNLLSGKDGNDTLDGGNGADTMKGGAGDDVFYVDNVGDKVLEYAGQGFDTVHSTVSFSLAAQYVEALFLEGAGAINGTGNNQDNALHGNDAANLLNGGGGDDALYGGLGSDRLIGGAGADHFWFYTELGPDNVDTIVDFVSGADTIDLGGDAFAALGSASMADQFHAGTAAADADDRILYDAASGKIWYDADGSGSTAAVLFAQVAPNTALTYSDFVGHFAS